MLKRIALLLAICLMITGLAACGQQTTTTTAATTKADGTTTAGTTSAGTTATTKAGTKTEISVWMGSWWEGKKPEIVAAFEKDFPQYTLKLECLPINGYFDNAAAAILAGNPPDVIDLDVTQISSFAAKNLINDLTASVESKLNAADFIQPAWRSVHYNGKMYAMPTRGSGGVYYYNKKMFDDAGVAYPKEGWTYDDLLAMAKKITVPGQKYGVGIAADLSDPSNVMSSFSPVLWAYGGEYLSADYKKCTLDSAEAIKAIKYWTELYTVHKVVPEGSIGYTISRDVVPLLAANKVAMLPFGMSGIDVFKKDPNLQWDIVIPPSGKNRAGGWAYTIPVTAKHQKEAVDLLLWFAKPEIQAKLCATEPSNVKAWSLAEPWNTPMFQTIMKAANQGNTLPPVGKWGEIQTLIIKELQKVLQGQETPEAAGKALVALIDPLLK